MGAREIVKHLLGHVPSPTHRCGTDVLDRDWTFRSSRPDGVTRLVRLLASRNRHAAPPYLAIRPVVARRRWIAYFIYLPRGGLTAAHRFTLARLRAADAALAIVCATPEPSGIPEDIRTMADALYWKGLSGFDFSAYALVLGAIARLSPGADVLVMNDSTFGPFRPLDEMWPAFRWDLTGFTASGQIQNHIQSYAFHFRAFDRPRLDGLSRIFPAQVAFDHYKYAVYGQETAFAAAAARTMSVGALWYSDNRRCGDPSTFAALPLLDAGFPFLKKSLLHRNTHVYPRETLLDALRDRNHPVDGI